MRSTYFRKFPHILSYLIKKIFNFFFSAQCVGYHYNIHLFLIKVKLWHWACSQQRVFEGCELLIWLYTQTAVNRAAVVCVSLCCEQVTLCCVAVPLTWKVRCNDMTKCVRIYIYMYWWVHNLKQPGVLHYRSQFVCCCAAEHVAAACV